MARILLFCAMIAASLAGCAPSDPSYRPGAPTTTINASANEQQFNLYAAGNKVPLFCEMLLEGERVGFARDESGQLDAVAGQQTHPLKEGRYKWKRLPQLTQDGVPPNNVVESEAFFWIFLKVLFGRDDESDFSGQ
jgi:hypothetical protein